jgi:DNA mismatch endonuclease, patch repair protein
MAAIRSFDTVPEQRLARLLKKHGVRFVRNAADLPGRPDFAFPSQKVAVFVHGCFWRGCPSCYVRPSVNVAYWTAKAERNMQRDRRVRRQLWGMGWRVVTVWECKLDHDASRCVARVMRSLRTRRTAV